MDSRHFFGVYDGALSPEFCRSAIARFEADPDKIVGRVGDGTKVDNLVQIGHNCQIGKHNLLISQIGLAGSCDTGDYVVIAGQAGIVDHVTIGTGAIIGAKAGVTKDVPAGQRYLGAPATPERDQKRILMSLEKLPEMRKDMKKIKQQLGIKDEAA